MSLDYENITPDEAYEIIGKLMLKFNWKGHVFTAEDIIRELESRGIDPTGYAIDAVQNTTEWSKWLNTLVRGYGWDMVSSAVDAVR